VRYRQPILIRCGVGLALLASAAFPARAEPAGVSPTPSAPALAALPPPPDVPPVTEAAFAAPASPKAYPRGRSVYLALITREAARRGLPPAVADAVAMVESAYSPTAVGAVGEMGLMQVRPTTAAMLGFRGGLTELFEPETNIRYGVAYLAEAWRLTGGQLCQALMKYRAGHGEERMTQRSVEYCVRARLHLAAIGSPLAKAPVPQAVADAAVTTPGLGRAASRRGVRSASRGPARAAAIRRSIWAAHDRRFKAIQSKISSASLRIMQ
jgi:hypothetical protein